MFLASGCSGGENPIEIASSCLPSIPEVVLETLPSKPPKMNVFLDTSVSSTNFGKTNLDTAYRDVLGFLREEADSSAEVQLYGFAKNVAPLTVAQLNAAARGQSAICQRCGFSETRLDGLLKQISESDNAPLSVVVTDLWLDNNDLLDSRSLSLSRPLRDIMSSGKAIGIIGIRAPYSSEVYDVPVSGSTQTIRSGIVSERPFFILLIGKPSEVLGFKDMLYRDVLASDSGRENYVSVFSPVPITGSSENDSGANTLAVLKPYGDRTPFSNGSFYVSDLEEIPVVSLNFRQVAKLSLEKDQDASSLQPQGLLVPVDGRLVSSIDLSSNTWELEGPWSDACDSDSDLVSWVKISDFPKTILAEKAGSNRLIYSGAEDDWLDLPRGATYYMEWSASSVGAVVHGDQNWASNWSFAPEAGSELISSPPDFFPVLNLIAFHELLSRAQAESLHSPVVSRGGIIITTE